MPETMAMEDNKKISCVIVNYNDSDTTEKQIRRIYRYKTLDAVVVVDNCSTDGSADRLTKLAAQLDPEKIMVLTADKNGGYGAGNNKGIEYSYEVLQMDYVLIANPDVEFSEELPARLAHLFERHPDLGAASALMEDETFGNGRNGWPLLGLLGEVLRTGPVCRRLFSRFLEYSPKYYEGKKAVYVDAVHGSLLMVDAVKMIECGEYDEQVFLYNEEESLGWRMLERGYRTVLLLTDSYVHRHSESISKTYKKIWERQKLRNQSALYYYRHYLGMNRIQEGAVRLFFLGVHLEIWFCSSVLRMKW